MGEWDRRPALDPSTGLPYSFIQMPLETHVALWSAAPYKLLSQSTYAALLVSMHGTALYERRDLAALSPAQRALTTEYLDGQRALQARLADRLQADREQLRRNQRLLWTLDGLSLALCLRWWPFTATDVPASGDARDLRLHRGSASAGPLTLEPWPFRGERVEVRCEGRRLRGRFETQEQLDQAIEVAPLVTVTFELSA
jgi:hypothetical protein